MAGNGWELYNTSNEGYEVSYDSGLVQGGANMAYGDVRYDQVTSLGGDSWTFYGTAGEWVRITMTSGDMDTYLELRDPSGYFLAEDDDGGGDTNSQIYITSLPSTGTYTIVARGYDGDTGSYELMLE